MNKIKAHRFIQNLTQDELSQLSGIERTKISRIERGFTEPKEEDVTSLAEALKATPEELFLKA